MKKVLGLLEIINLILLLLSLYFKSDVLLIIASIVMFICIILTFMNKDK